MTTYRGEDMIGDNGYGTTEHALKSAHAALWAIANMQVQEETDKGEVLALCMSIARLEHREDGFAITVGLMEYISGWSALEILYWLHEKQAIPKIGRAHV